MDLNPGLSPEAAKERDRIRRRTLTRLGNHPSTKTSTRLRDDAEALRPLDTYRARPKRT